MSDELQKVGVRLVAEGEDSFIKTMNEMQKQITQAVQSVSKLAEAASRTSTGGVANMAQSLGELESQAVSAGSGISGLSLKTIALGTALGNILGNAIKNVIGYFKNLEAVIGKLQESTLGVASRFKQTQMASYLMGQRMGFTTQQVQGFIDGLREAGITADVATNLILEMSRAELDLSKSVELARVAQNAAVVANRDSSDTLRRLTYGIMTYNTLILRSAGITLTGSQAYAEYAKEIGKTSRTLTAAERQQAIFNAVLKEGEKIVGFYELSMENANKVLGSIPRVLNDITIAMGSPFERAFFNMVNSVYKGLGMISEALGKDVPTAAQKTEMAVTRAQNSTMGFSNAFRIAQQEVEQATKHVGVLKDTLEKAGGVVSWFTQNLTEMTKKGTQNALIGLGNLADRMEGFAVNAFNWGWNMIQEYGAGIIQGAASILTSAMQFISNILTSWMRPGSPPKILPDIDEWGGQTLEEWLHGMTTADFSILNQVSGTIQQLFRSMGEFDPSTMLDIEKMLVTAFDTGEFDPSLMSALTENFGEYGDEVADLVTKQLELATAMNEVAEAEEALKNVREEAEDQHEKISEMVEEYNKLVRDGADPAILKQKREQIRIEQEALKVKEDEVDEAQDAYREAVKQATPLQQQIQLQEQLIQQIIRMLDLQEQAKKLQEGGGGETPLEEPDAPDLGDIGGDLGGGLSDIQQAIHDALDGWAEDVRAWYDEQIQPVINDIKDAWETMVGALKDFWDNSGIEQTIIDTWNRIKNAFVKSIPAILDNLVKSWESFFEGMTTSMEDAGVDVQGIIDGINGFIELIGLFIEDALTAFEQISDYLPGFSGTTGEIIGGLISTFLEFGNELVSTILPKVQEFEKKVREWLDEGGLKTVLENVQRVWEGFKEALQSPFAQKVIKGILKVLTVIGGLKLAFSVILTPLRIFKSIFEKITPIFAPLLGKLGFLKNLFIAVSGVVRPLLGLLGDKLVTLITGKLIPAIGSIIAGINPVVAIIAGVIALAGLLYLAWQKNFLGIRDIVTEAFGAVKSFITDNFLPIWESLKARFDVMVLAVQTVASIIWDVLLLAFQVIWDFISNFVWPMIKVVADFLISVFSTAWQVIASVINDVVMPILRLIWDYLSNVIFPIFQTIAEFLSGVFTAVWTAISQFWQNVFLPILQAIWGFISNNVLPLFVAVADFVGTIMSTVFKVLAGIFTNIVLPAIRKVVEWIGEKLHPVFVDIKTFIDEKVKPVLEKITEVIGEKLTEGVQKATDWFNNKFKPALDAIGAAFDKVTGFIKSMTEKLKNIKLPDWLTPGSPTPLETGLGGVNEALNILTQQRMQQFAQSLKQIGELILRCMIDPFMQVAEVTPQIVTQLAESSIQIFMSFAEMVINIFKSLGEATTTEIHHMWQDVVDVTQNAIEILMGVFETLIELIEHTFIENDWAGIGDSISDGIVQGINRSSSRIASAARVAALNALKAAKDELGIKSPAKRPSDEVGRPFAEGIAMGILGGIDRINQAVVRAMAGTVSPAMAGGAVQYGNQIIENKNTRQYNLSVITSNSPSVVRQSFEVMEAVSI